MSKGLEFLISAVPTAKRISAFWNPDTPSHTPGIKAVEGAARTFRVQLQLVGARTAADLEGAFAAMARAPAQTVLVLGLGLYVAERQRLAELVTKYRLPTMFTLFRDHVEAGGLMSYGPDTFDLARRGAIYVDKILRGAKPGELPVEQPTKFELVINMKTRRRRA